MVGDYPNASRPVNVWNDYLTTSGTVFISRKIGSPRAEMLSMRFLLLSTAFALLTLCPVLGQAPLQQWIDEAVKAGGGVVTVPPGVHVLPAGLVIKEAKKLALRGMEKELCILKLEKAGKGRSLIEITANSETIEIANLTLQGAEKELPALVTVNGAKAVTVRDCLFEGGKGHGVMLTGAQATTVERCSFRDFGLGALLADAATNAGKLVGNHAIRCGKAFEVKEPARWILSGNEEH